MRKSISMGFIVLCMGVVASFQAAYANDQIKLDDFAFMAGTWDGVERDATNPMAEAQTSDATIVEYWSEPVAGAITGVFTWANGADILVYEFIIVRETEDGVIMRFKHFTGDLTGWEEKDEYLELKAIEAAENEIIFHQIGGDLRLEYRLIENGALEIIAADKNSFEVQFGFDMTRR